MDPIAQQNRKCYTKLMGFFETYNQTHQHPVNRALHTMGSPGDEKEIAMPSSSIAFFDVDHTLIDGNSGFYTSMRLVRHGVMKKRRVVQAVYYSLAALLFHQDIKKIYQTAITDLAGCTLDQVLKIGEECFEQDIKPRLYSDGMKSIREHQKRGDHVVFLTAAPYMLIHWFQDHVGVEEAHCMGPELNNGILSDQLISPLCHAEGKIYYAEQSSKKHNIPLSDCYFYSDHMSDLPLLEKVGHPCVVNPNRKLKRLAKERGWPIKEFRR